MTSKRVAYMENTGPFGIIIPYDVFYYMFEFCIVDICTNPSLFLVCKFFNQSVTKYWKNKFPNWPFHIIPRAPVLIPQKLAIFKHDEYYQLEHMIKLFMIFSCGIKCLTIITILELGIKFLSRDSFSINMMDSVKMMFAILDVKMQNAYLDSPQEGNTTTLNYGILQSFPKLMLHGDMVMVQKAQKLVFIEKREKICKRENIYFCEPYRFICSPSYNLENYTAYSISLEEVKLLRSFVGNKSNCVVTLQISETGLKANRKNSVANHPNEGDFLEFGHLGKTYDRGQFLCKYLYNMLDHANFLCPERTDLYILSVRFNNGQVEAGPVLIEMKTDMYRLVQVMSDITEDPLVRNTNKTDEIKKDENKEKLDSDVNDSEDKEHSSDSKHSEDNNSDKD